MTSYRICFFYRRKFRPATTEPPEGIKAVFRQYADGAGIMSSEQFRHFIEQVQGETDTDAAAAAAAVHKYRGVFHKKGSLTVDDFFRYLSSTEDNPPLSPNLGVSENTSPVELMKCLNAIKANAFTASPYPVILTLEDHLTPDLQSKVAFR